MQDNAPAHSAARVTIFLAEIKIEVLPWPAQSSDLNQLRTCGRLERRGISLIFACQSQKTNLSIDLRHSGRYWFGILPEFS